MKLKKVLVTGGTGFIGSHVVERLIDDGVKVIVMDHSVPGFLLDLPKTSSIEIFHGDVMDDVAVTEAAAHVDGIIHLAAVLGTQETIQNPRPSARTNILGSLNIFEAANQYSLPVVYAGVGNHWMREHGAGSYTISKTAVEDYAKMFNKFRDGKISIVRPVNAYGLRQSIASPFGPSRVRKIMPSFICRALLGEPIEVYGDGTQISDCVHVKDVARVFVEALYYTHENGPLDKVEVGPIESVTVQQIADKVRDAAFHVTGKYSRIVNLPMRPGEVPQAVVSADLTELATLGINPEDFVSLDDGIQRTVEWYFRSWYPKYVQSEGAN